MSQDGRLAGLQATIVLVIVGLLVWMYVSLPAHADEPRNGGRLVLQDAFAKVKGDKAEVCWGPKWSGDTRPDAAALHHGVYIVNENPIMCDTETRCEALECYFRGNDGYSFRWINRVVSLS